MKVLLSLMILGLALSGSQLFAHAEVKIDESLKQNFSYMDNAPVLKPEAMTLLMLHSPQQKETNEEKTGMDKPQCFAVNKQFVNCHH